MIAHINTPPPGRILSEIAWIQRAIETCARQIAELEILRQEMIGSAIAQGISEQNGLLLVNGENGYRVESRGAGE